MPVYVDGDGTTYWFEYSAAIAPDGTVHVANVLFSEDYHGPADVVVWRSVDADATRQTATVATSEEPAEWEWSPGCESRPRVD